MRARHIIEDEETDSNNEANWVNLCDIELDKLFQLRYDVKNKIIKTITPGKEAEAAGQMHFIFKLAEARKDTSSREELKHLVIFLMDLRLAIQTPTPENKSKFFDKEEKAIGAYRWFKILYGAGLILLGILVVATAVVTSIAVTAASFGLAAPIGLAAGISMGVTGGLMVGAGAGFLFFTAKKSPHSENLMLNVTPDPSAGSAL